MTNKRLWGRLALLGVVLLAGCRVEAEMRARHRQQAPSDPASFVDTARGVACYSAPNGRGFSCVKVTP